VSKLCDLILTEALLNKATEVRLAEYEADRGTVEYQINGDWQRVMAVPIQAHRALVNRLRVMAGLDASRKPLQRGTLHVAYDGHMLTLPITVEALTSGADMASITISAAAT
jgi:type II secretory ATPase GspE/PulE/Tfp pilus assembly ATPase PilB-like protein